MKPFRDLCCALVGASLLALPCAAQLVLGDNLKLNLNGDIGSNYMGSLNDSGSGHSLGLMGDANLVGSYYNPNFLNFNIQPYYNRTQNNSAFGSVTDTSGLNSNLNLFSGGHFPGSIFYSKGANSVGEFGIPGSSLGLATHGDNQGFGISWSAVVPDWPTLTASYSVGSGSSSVFGAQEGSSQTNHDFSLRSSYLLSGFHLNGGYDHRTVDSTFSELLQGEEQPFSSTTSTNNYQVNAQHSFPLQGSFSVGWTRSGYDYSSQGTNGSGTSDSLNGNLAFHPATKLNLAFSGAYNDSLLASVPQQIINSGAASAVNNLGTFHSYAMSADGSYEVFRGLGVHGTVNHVQQQFLGRSYGVTQVAGNVNYTAAHNFLGSLSFSVGVVDSANKEGNQGLGAVANLNFFRKIRGWDVGANTSYSQNVQTLVAVYTTSSMSYSASARRRLGSRMYYYAGYSGSHSGISAQAGNMSSAERVSSSFTYRAYSINGYYSTSHGTAVFTPTGLVAVSPSLPPSIFAPGSLMVFDARAYGFNLSASPRRRLNMSAGYGDAWSDSINPSLTTFTRTNIINGSLQYRLRKLYVNGGFTRLRQSLGTPGSSPVVVTTYYVGISRWFNFF